VKNYKLYIIFVFLSIFFVTIVNAEDYYDKKFYIFEDDSLIDEENIVIKNKDVSLNNKNLKLALKYKYKLSLKGINYIPWEDRLNNDIILMKKLLKINFGNRRFDNFNIVSTVGKNFYNKRKKILFLNYKQSNFYLKQFLLN
jgi:hypothetical protein